MKSLNEIKAFEKLQSLAAPNISHSLSKHILVSSKTLNKKLESINLLDLGSGTGYLVNHALKTIRKIKTYTAVDLCDLSLKYLKDFEINAQVTTTKLENAIDTSIDKQDLIICLSNTFLALASDQELNNFLLRFKNSKSKSIMLLSITPWSVETQKWLLNYQDWISFNVKDDLLKMKSTQIESSLQIKQELHLQDNNKTYLWKHNFNKTTLSSFKHRLKKIGLNHSNWINPSNFQKVSKNVILPEYWIEIRNF